MMLYTKDTKKIKALTEFLWKSSRAKIAMKKLWLPGTEGGTILTNIRLYNITCLLRHSLDWLKGTSTYSILEVERAIAHTWDLAALLHVTQARLPRELKNNFLIRGTIIAWKSLWRELKLPVTMSLHFPLEGKILLPQDGGNTRLFTTGQRTR